MALRSRSLAEQVLLSQASVETRTRHLLPATFEPRDQLRLARRPRARVRAGGPLQPRLREGRDRHGTGRRLQRQRAGERLI